MISRFFVVWLGVFAFVCASAGEAKDPPSLDFHQQALSAEQVASLQAEWAKRLKVDVELTNSVGMRMRLIPPGKFQMGSPETEKGRRPDETGAFAVVERPFVMSATEVTQSQWETIMGANPSDFSAKSPNVVILNRIGKADASRFPVETVSWYQAIEFCNALSVKEELKPYYELIDIVRKGDAISKATVKPRGGTGYRLPTELEWEYACRAGTISPFHFGDQSNGVESNVTGVDPYGAKEKGPDKRRPTEVASYPANALGLFDMSGNVSEYCYDWYAAEREKRSDPATLVDGGQRVVRGGAWMLAPSLSRSAARSKASPVERSHYRGFRVVRGE